MLASMVSTLLVLTGIIVMMNAPAGSANAQPFSDAPYWRQPIA
jgi:hypothetical protein